MKIAVEGCCHGQLDAIYRQIASLERQHSYTVDLLLICGDFQAIRNHQDLQCMAVPNKYRQLGDFHKYYTGEKVAPVLTIIIGGNHEASNYFWELYHGGWVAPNIYFLGHAGCVQVDGIRIAGASGIYKPQSFRQGSWEKLPYDNGSMRSIYHIREYNIRRLSLLSSPHIFLSHDWPQSIERYGSLQDLLRRKPFFREDVDSGRLGSPPLMGLLMTLKPQWWFAAHLHVRFEATVVHSDENNRSKDTPIQPGAAEMARVDASSIQPLLPQERNPDEIAIDLDDFEDVSSPAVAAQEESVAESTPSGEDQSSSASAVVDPAWIPSARGDGGRTGSETRFLALDKCLPRRAFLEVMDIPATEANEQLSSSSSAPGSTATSRSCPILTFDPQWLAITRAFHPYLSTSRSQPAFPNEEQAVAMVRKEMEWVMENVVGADGTRRVDERQTFTPTAPGAGQEPGNAKFQQPPWYTNPQTEAFCAMLELENKINPPPLAVLEKARASQTQIQNKDSGVNDGSHSPNTA